VYEKHGHAGGIQINKNGYMWYGSIGVVTPGKGIAVVYSDNDPQQNSTTITTSGAFGLAGSATFPFTYEIQTLSDGEYAGGVGSPGASLMINHSFGFVEW
jgi:hypothetical protein